MVESIDRFDSWISSCQDKQQAIYFVINPLAQSRPLQAFYQAGGENARSLFADTVFIDLTEQGAYLLRADSNTEWYQWWQNNQSDGEGFVFSSSYPADLVFKYWRSLLVVFLDKREVFFRYFDSRVMAPMLKAFDPPTCKKFMGPANSLMIFDQVGEWAEFSSESPHLVNVQSMPWWEVQSSQMVETDRPTQTLKVNLKRWLWVHQHPWMNELYRNGEDVDLLIDEAFKQAVDNNMPAKLRPAFVVNLLVHGIQGWPNNRPVSYDQLSEAEILEQVMGR